MSNIKGIFDKIYIGTGIVDDQINVVKVNGNVNIAGNLGLGLGNMIYFGNYDINNSYGIKDDNGTLKYKNASGIWTNFFNLNNNYINFSDNSGIYPENPVDGFGIRNNQGILEFKNLAGNSYTSWTTFGTGGSGGTSGSGNVAGQLYYGVFDVNTTPSTGLVGGVETDVILSTNMTTMGKIHCDVWEFVEASDGYVDNTWKINKDDSNFIMYNFKKDRINITITPSALSGNITLTASANNWTIDDEGLEYYGNGGSAVITTWINSTSVNAIVRNNFTNINAESDWKLYGGNFDNDGSFNITSTKSLQGIYRIMPEGLVNLYGISQGSVRDSAAISIANGISTDQYSMTYIPPANNGTTLWPNATYGSNNAEAKITCGHHCIMYNPQIAVNNKINMIAVASSGMFYKKVLSNNTSSSISLTDKSTIPVTISNTGYASYYSQDLLYFIKDGYTVTKREKIFPSSINNISAGSVGGIEFNSINSKQSNILNIYYTDYVTSHTTFSLSIIAVNLYFVICGIYYYIDSTIFQYLIICSYNSRGEIAGNINIKVVTTINGQSFYPKIFNGNGNDIWVFYYTVNTTTPFTPLLNFTLLSLSDKGVFTISKTESKLYSALITGSGLNVPYFTYDNSSNIYRLKLFQNGGSSSFYNTNPIFCQYIISINSQFYTNVVGGNNFVSSIIGTFFQDTNSYLLDNYSSTQLSRYLYVNLDVVVQNNYIYVIFSANTVSDLNTYNLYYAFFPTNNYTVSSTVDYTNISNKITGTNLDNNAGYNFSNYAQIIPKCLYDSNSRRILVVWLGKSQSDILGTNPSLRGTYYKFINLKSSDTTTDNNILSITAAVKLSNNVPGQGGYYNLVQKSNGNIHLLFNAGHNCIYEYVLPVNSSSFYVRLSPTRNIKHAMGYNKILPGVVYDGYVRASYTGKLSVGIYNDRIVGVGQLINPDVVSAVYNNDFISSYINTNANKFYQKGADVSLVHSVPTTSTFFYEVTSSYDWNIYNRISDSWITQNTNNLGDFSDTDITQSIFRIYQNVFYVIFTCTTTIVTVKKLFFSYSVNSGQSWSYPIRVTNVSSSSHTVYPENNPDMIIDSTGNMHIVFESNSGDIANTQIYYVKGTNLPNITFTDIFASKNSLNTTNLKHGISGVVGYDQLFPRIIKCGNTNLAVCWHGTNSISPTLSKIFVNTHTNNGNTTTSWSTGNLVISNSDWNYLQNYPILDYNSNGILLLSWRGKNINQTVYDRIFVAISIDNGINFTAQASTTYVNSTNTIYNSSIITHETYLDNSNMIHIMFLISSNVITNSLGYYNYISGNSGTPLTLTQTPQSDIFVTRASLGNINSSSSLLNISSALSNLSTTNKWSDPYLLTNYRYNITSYQNSTYGTYGHGLQILKDNNNLIYYIYKMRFMNYSTDLYTTTISQVSGGSNPAYLSFCTFNGINYSDVKSIMNEYFYSNITGTKTNNGFYPATSTSGYYYNASKPSASTSFNFEYSFTVDINTNNNNIYLLCNSFYNQYYGSNMTNRTNMYLYEYTQDNKFFGVLDYRPILNYDKLLLANQPTDTFISDLNPYTILLSNGTILSVYSSANGTASTGTNFKSGYYYNGIVSYYNPNNNSKFVVRSSNTTNNNFTYTSSPYEIEKVNGVTGTDSILTMTEKFAGTISSDTDYWNSFTLVNTPKPVTGAISMIILGVCQDPINTSNIYILYRMSNNYLTYNSNYNTPYDTPYNNLYITYTNSFSNSTGSLVSNTTDFNFNTAVKVVLETSGTFNTSGDSNNIVLSGSIFAYNNVVYVVYTNANGRLFFSRLTYSITGLLFTTTSQNTFYVTSVNNSITYNSTAATVTSGEGNGIGKHVIDYSLVSNNLVLHVLYHGAITNNINNKVYYYFNITNTTATTPTFSPFECVVPPIYQTNTLTTSYLIGYGDMVVDRIYNKIYVVYSTHNFPVCLASVSNKEHGRFIVYTYKDMSNVSLTQWSTNTQFDICTGTTSGFSQAIYKNPNGTTSENYSSCDQYPKLYLKNNILHMVTLGNHYNGYLSGNPSSFTTGYLNVNYIKYYFKNLSDQYSRFVNNNQPVNKSLYFNTEEIYSVQSRQFYYNHKFPSIIVDNNNTIHIMANIVSNYAHNTNINKTYRNYHFLTTDDATYKKDTYVSTITKSTNTSKWLDIKDFILSDSSNSQTALYSICFQYSNYDNWYVFNSTGSRLIMQYDISGQTFATNTNSTYSQETLTAYTNYLSTDSIDERAIKALELALSNVNNQMTSQQLNTAVNFNYNNSTVLNIRFAIMLKTNNPFITPQTTDLTINYSLAGYLKNVTTDYIIKIKSTSIVSFTPPNDGQSRTAYIYITDGSSAGNTATTVVSYTEIIQNVDTLEQIISSQSVLPGYTKLTISNGSQYYLTNNNINNTYYTILGASNNIKINNSGKHKIDISFDYKISNNATIYFSIDGTYQEALKSNSISNVYDRVMISKVQTVSFDFNFNLYMKSDSSDDTTISIKNLKIYIQKL